MRPALSALLACALALTAAIPAACAAPGSAAETEAGKFKVGKFALDSVTDPRNSASASRRTIRQR